MFSLAEKYWKWRNRKPIKFKTENGYTAKRFGESWAICCWYGCYRDLVHTHHSWSESSRFFRDCLTSREEIEKRFGKILD